MVERIKVDLQISEEGDVTTLRFNLPSSVYTDYDIGMIYQYLSHRYDITLFRVVCDSSNCMISFSCKGFYGYSRLIGFIESLA